MGNEVGMGTIGKVQSTSESHFFGNHHRCGVYKYAYGDKCPGWQLWDTVQCKDIKNLQKKDISENFLRGFQKLKKIRLRILKVKRWIIPPGPNAYESNVVDNR